MNVLSLETNSPSDFFTIISITNKTAMQTHQQASYANFSDEMTLNAKP